MCKGQFWGLNVFEIDHDLHVLRLLYVFLYRWILPIFAHFPPSLIIFSGNCQTKNNENFQYGSETLPIVDKQTYLGIEMTSSGRYTYARDILSKKAYKVLATVKR